MATNNKAVSSASHSRRVKTPSSLLAADCSLPPFFSLTTPKISPTQGARFLPIHTQVTYSLTFSLRASKITIYPVPCAIWSRIGLDLISWCQLLFCCQGKLAVSTTFPLSTRLSPISSNPSVFPPIFFPCPPFLSSLRSSSPLSPVPKQRQTTAIS